MTGKSIVLCVSVIVLSLFMNGGGNVEGKEKVICVAHRGGAGCAPENTPAAFKKAIALGADMVECDIHLSKDGHMVVIHDDRLDRTTNGKGLVREKTLAELKALDAGSWYGGEFAGEKISTLEELLDLAQGKVEVIIESAVTEAVAMKNSGDLCPRCACG
jgi:glycerophosphoryl diester phosphodiesterase